MEDRDGKLISPGVFLDSAERFGLAVLIDHMVVRKAIRKIQSFDAQEIWISLNLSYTALKDETLFDYIRGLLAESALPAGKIHFEVTEAAAMEYFDKVHALGEQLEAMGCSLVLDDFGHGPAQHYLQQLPVHMVKIDASLIRSLHTHPANQTLVKNLTTLAHGLGIQVVAKFVEDAALLPLLRELDVDYAQGFAIGRPMESIEQLRAIAESAT